MSTSCSNIIAFFCLLRRRKPLGFEVHNYHSLLSCAQCELHCTGRYLALLNVVIVGTFIG